MPNEQYSAVPLDETGEAVGGIYRRKRSCARETVKTVLLLAAFAVVCFVLGFGVGHNWRDIGRSMSWPQSGEDGALNPQAFIPEIPLEEVMFNFPTPYEDTGIEGDKLWNELMPLGSGFLRVPYPRRFDMPQSKSIENDPEEGEIYSLSVTHQLHCLGVSRDVIKKYEKKDKARFAGDGHEYHCIDYIRQSILCAGDTTLDFAEIFREPDGAGRRLGFSGANSTHICRSWDAIKHFAIENRSGDKTGIA
ncbi:hypothetical protein BDZ45DRAFT_678557 [Acephala macrosclerotiorum]|nr:hypothetical protein BDZ45DRAFT_678557 [Acephala macrosclerotiorum]